MLLSFNMHLRQLNYICCRRIAFVCKLIYLINNFILSHFCCPCFFKYMGFQNFRDHSSSIFRHILTPIALACRNYFHFETSVTKEDTPIKAAEYSSDYQSRISSLFAFEHGLLLLLLKFLNIFISGCARDHITIIAM